MTGFPDGGLAAARPNGGAGSAAEPLCHAPSSPAVDEHYDPTHFDEPDAAPAPQHAPPLLDREAPAGPALQFRDYLFDPARKDVSVDNTSAMPVPPWLVAMAEDENNGQPPEEHRPKQQSKLDDFNAGSQWMAGMLEDLRKDQVPMELQQRLLDV